MNSFPDILRGSVWHTTTPERFQSIVKSGFLLPDPDIPDKDRWGTGLGESHYPFVRSLGGVSLFDFRQFDEKAYPKSYPNSSVYSFVPCSHRSSIAVWIEIDTDSVTQNIIFGDDLLVKWKNSNELGRKIMPLIEAAHIGPVPIATFLRILVYHKESNIFF